MIALFWLYADHVCIGSKALTLATDLITKDGTEDEEFAEKLLRGDIELTSYDCVNKHLVLLL